MTLGCRTQLNSMSTLFGARTLAAWFTTASDKPSHPPQQNTWHRPKASPSPALFWPQLHSVACSSVWRLLSLLTFLLERALQESTIHRVIHIFVLKPGAEHSLPLPFPLDYICSIKCIFKSHIRGCGETSLHSLGQLFI